jgi:hypothetical protein
MVFKKSAYFLFVPNQANGGTCVPHKKSERNTKISAYCISLHIQYQNILLLKYVRYVAERLYYSFYYRVNIYIKTLSTEMG